MLKRRNRSGLPPVNDALPSGELAAPFNGVIVRWHVGLGRETDAPAIRIRALRRMAPEEFKLR